jgi:hypothetical protein
MSASRLIAIMVTVAILAATLGVLTAWAISAAT